MFAGSTRFRSLWTPRSITTALWLDAADSSTITTVSGRVSEWMDKSGNNRHAVQSISTLRPIYSSTTFSGKPGLIFDGTDDRLLHGLTSTPSGSTIFGVYRVDSSQTGYRGLISVGEQSSSAGSVVFIRTNAGQFGSFGSSEINSTFAYSNGQVLLFAFEDDNSSSLKTFWVNGSASGTYTSNPVGQVINNNIGGDSGQSSGIALCEIIAVTGIATSVTRQKIEGYLAHKWGLIANLSSDHPFKNYLPRGA